MTDKEIIKALEWCSDDSSDYCCELGRDCTDGSCMNKLMKAALSLIQRQQEEIESKINANFSLFVIKSAKAEAIKEFADRLKADMFYKCGDMNYTETCEARKLIDSLLKEMAGETDDR